MNITLYPQDFTQGAITINGNIGSLKQIRTPEYILLDDTWNFQDLTIAVTFKSEINKTPKIALFGYESLDTSRSCFNKTYSGSPYVQELTSHPKVKYIRMHIGFDDNTDILPDDIETITISSECIWIMTNDAFALIYRPDDPYSDLAKAIEFIYDHTEELEVDVDYYSLWGGSAGARMAATLGNADNLNALTQRSDIQQAGAVIMQYTGYNASSPTDAPTYACVGTNDGIANYRTMQNRFEGLESYGIPTEFQAYEGLPHGFGIETGANAEGWIYDAVRFWEEQMPDNNIPEHHQLANLQDFLLARTTNAHGNDYDLDDDGTWNVFDLCLVRRRYLTQNSNIPSEIKEIPQNYYTSADEQGTLEELYYDTYESMTYDEKSQILNKRAIVYLPYGYSDDEQYDVFYLMHGGWSNETSTLGTPANPSAFQWVR